MHEPRAKKQFPVVIVAGCLMLLLILPVLAVLAWLVLGVGYVRSTAPRAPQVQSTSPAPAGVELIEEAPATKPAEKP